MTENIPQKEKSQEVEDSEADQYFDAQSNVSAQPEARPVVVDYTSKPEASGWPDLKKAFTTISDKLMPQTGDDTPTAEEIIIKIKDEHKRELQREDMAITRNAEEAEEEMPTVIPKKGLKLTIVLGSELGPNSSRQTEVTVLNEDDIKIDANDIEMNVSDQIKFLFNLIIVLILDLFIISGIAHWIYNYLEGLDWKLENKTHFNFHIFFMTLGISGFGIGMLVHRMFRGWSSGALKFLHTFLTLTTLIFFVIGIYAAIDSLLTMQSIHFYSVHSWLGMLSILSFLSSWISAFVIYIFPRFSDDIQSTLAPVHSFVGRLVFTLICATAVTGLSDKLRISDTEIDLGPINTVIDYNYTESERITFPNWKIPNEVFLCNVMAIAILVFSVFVNYLSSNESYKRRLLPDEQGIEIRTVVVK